MTDDNMNSIKLTLKNETKVNILVKKNNVWTIKFTTANGKNTSVSLPIKQLELDHYTTDVGIDIVMEELSDKVELMVGEDCVTIKRALIPLIDKISAKIY